jgi:hypothetical protein
MLLIYEGILTVPLLVKDVTHQLTRLLPHADKNAFDEGMAVRIVKNAEEVVGLSSVRAVVGAAERIREVIGFAAISTIERFAQLLAQTSGGISKADWAQRLASLEKGQCWSLGRVLKSGGGFKEEAVLVSVTSLENRHF